MDVCLFWVFCFVKQRSLRRAYDSSRGVLPSAGCLSVIVKPHKGRTWTGLGSKRHRKKNLDCLQVLTIYLNRNAGFLKSVSDFYINCSLATNVTIQRLNKLLIILPYVACFRYSAIYMPMIREVAWRIGASPRTPRAVTPHPSSAFPYTPLHSTRLHFLFRETSW